MNKIKYLVFSFLFVLIFAGCTTTLKNIDRPTYASEVISKELFENKENWQPINAKNTKDDAVLLPLPTPKPNKDLSSKFSKSDKVKELEKTKENQAKEILALEEKLKEIEKEKAEKDTKLKEIEKEKAEKQAIQVQFDLVLNFKQLSDFISKNKSFDLTLIKQKINDVAKTHKNIDLQFLNNRLETTNNEEEITKLVIELERI